MWLLLLTAMATQSRRCHYRCRHCRCGHARWTGVCACDDAAQAPAATLPEAAAVAAWAWQRQPARAMTTTTVQTPPQQWPQGLRQTAASAGWIATTSQ